jgi:hypothetical protein
LLNGRVQRVLVELTVERDPVAIAYAERLPTARAIEVWEGKLRPPYDARGSKKPLLPIVRPAMSFEDDFRRVEENVAEARRLVQSQKGLIVRLRAAGANTLDAQRILWLLESNLRRFEEHRDRLRAE